MACAAAGIIDNGGGNPFYIPMENFGVKLIQLPKRIMIGIASDAPTYLVPMDMEKPTTASYTVNFVHYKPNVYTEEQMKIHSKVTAEGTERDQTN